MEYGLRHYPTHLFYLWRFDVLREFVKGESDDVASRSSSVVVLGVARTLGAGREEFDRGISLDSILARLRCVHSCIKRSQFHLKEIGNKKSGYFYFVSCARGVFFCRCAASHPAPTVVCGSTTTAGIGYTTTDIVSDRIECCITCCAAMRPAALHLLFHLLTIPSDFITQ